MVQNNFYAEKNRAKRHAISFINEEFYPDAPDGGQAVPRKISLNFIKMELDLEFNCNYVKVFEDVMIQMMKGDKRITFNKEKEFWSVGE